MGFYILVVEKVKCKMLQNDSNDVSLSVCLLVYLSLCSLGSEVRVSPL